MIKEKEEQQIKEVCERFCLCGEYRSYEIINSGHINTTYRVYYFRNGELKDYILQRVNTYVFRDPVSVMDNISSVTEFIRAKIKAKQATAKRNVLHYAKTCEGDYYTFMDDGGFWRCAVLFHGVSLGPYEVPGIQIPSPVLHDHGGHSRCGSGSVLCAGFQ